MSSCLHVACLLKPLLPTRSSFCIARCHSTVHALAWADCCVLGVTGSRVPRRMGKDMSICWQISSTAASRMSRLDTCQTHWLCCIISNEIADWIHVGILCMGWDHELSDADILSWCWSLRQEYGCLRHDISMVIMTLTAVFDQPEHVASFLSRRGCCPFPFRTSLNSKPKPIQIRPCLVALRFHGLDEEQTLR